MRLMPTLIALALSTLLAGPALAQDQGGPNCRTLDAAVAEARDKYNERLVMRGISQGGYMIMLFATDDGQTWTLFGLLKDGKTACTLDAGVALQPVAPADQPQPEPDMGTGL